LDHSFRIGPDLATRHPGLLFRANRYYPLVRGSLSAVIVVMTVLALLEVWGLNALSWFAPNQLGGKVVSVLITIGIMLAIAIAVWELVNTALDRQIMRFTMAEQAVRAARLKTLQPILRTTLLILILVIVGLTALDQIGVNIAPLLAGAGIVGIAIGFGSQKLVQDFITGMFLLLENAIQVGDAVTVAGLSGNVEQLSVRTIWLRAGDGAVHIIPFSSVTSITNTSRGIGNAAIAVTVALEEDPDRVGAAMQEIAAAMREDPVFSPQMRSGLQGVGVDRLRASGVTLTGQIECTDSGRTPVQREFNRRMKQRFQELGIKIADPPP
ncbi:MAG: mechanosensitive ion channel, partial [Alphaproteobacteria bacterium]|nr:mechanosensitive ion channel [Alphaproteobacteria bacterium]